MRMLTAAALTTSKSPVSRCRPNVIAVSTAYASPFKGLSEMKERNKEKKRLNIMMRCDGSMPLSL